MRGNNPGEATYSSQQPAATECNECGDEFAEVSLFLTEDGNLLCNDCNKHKEPDFDAFPLNN